MSEIPPQLVANGIISAATIFLTGIGFLLCYKVARFFHFAHAAFFSAGAYVALILASRIVLPLFVSSFLACVAVGLMGFCAEYVVYRPLRSRESSHLTMLLASLGLYVVVINLISLLFGNDTFQITSRRFATTMILQVRLTTVQLLGIALSVLLATTVAILFLRTRLGKSMRSVANDATLANISGVQTTKIYLWTFSLGSALAAVAGIVTALDIGMNPAMGMSPMMNAVVAVAIAGESSVSGLAAAALFLGMTRHLVSWQLGSQWQDAIAFAILLVFLIFRPQGFFGKKIKKATV